MDVFSNDLAEDDHLIFADWAESVRRQGCLFVRLLRGEFGDAALAGHRLRATDLSPRAVARARRDASGFGVSLVPEVADLRQLAARVPGPFDAVLAGDEALPHLLTEVDQGRPAPTWRPSSGRGGLSPVSVRDDDRRLAERPRTRAAVRSVVGVALGRGADRCARRPEADTRRRRSSCKRGGQRFCPAL